LPHVSDQLYLVLLISGVHRPLPVQLHALYDVILVEGVQGRGEVGELFLTGHYGAEHLSRYSVAAEGDQYRHGGVLHLEAPNICHQPVCEAEFAVVVDGDVPVEEVSAGTGVELGGGTFPLIVAEHPLP